MTNNNTIATNIPQPPVFLTKAEERQYRKEKLAATFRIFGRMNFDFGFQGHVSARDPELTDHFWINPLGKSFNRMKVSDLILVNPNGEVVEGNHPVSRAAFAVHGPILWARPEIVSVAHAHSIAGKAWASLGRLLDPITQESCAFYNDHSLYEDYSTQFFDPVEGERIAGCLGKNKAVIVRNHGPFTVGNTVDEAAWWFISMDNSCQAQLLAESAGNPVRLGDVEATATHKELGSARLGWLQFQSYWEEVTYLYPDLLE